MTVLKIGRWTSKRKAELILNSLRMTPRELRQLLVQHEVSTEEFASWVALYNSGGLKALRTTRLQEFRPLLNLRGRR